MQRIIDIMTALLNCVVISMCVYFLYSDYISNSLLSIKIIFYIFFMSVNLILLTSIFCRFHYEKILSEIKSNDKNL